MSVATGTTAQGSTDSGQQQQGAGNTGNQGNQQQGNQQGNQQGGQQQGNQGNQGTGGQQGGGGGTGQQQGTGDKSGQQQGGQQGQQQGEQGAQGKGEQTGGKADAGSQQSKAPAKYELKLPDGGHVDDSDRERLEQVARANDWSNEDAQAALEEFGAQLKAQSDAFETATRSDPDYGGDKLVESQRLAKLAIDRVRPTGHPRRDNFLRFINRAGAGNHIEVVAFLADLGKLMGEDGATGGSGGARGGQKTAADVLYDHPTSVALNEKTKR